MIGGQIGGADDARIGIAGLDGNGYLTKHDVVFAFAFEDCGCGARCIERFFANDVWLAFSDIDIEFAPETFASDFEMELAHATEQEIARVFVFFVDECRVFFV